MTVKDLIQVLQKLDQDKNIFVAAEGVFPDIIPIEVDIREYHENETGWKAPINDGDYIILT